MKAGGPQTRQRYKEQDSSQTLGDGLREYYATSEYLFDVAKFSGPARELFVNHDVSHVVFGCDTSRNQEVIIDAWTVFGSDAGARYLLWPQVWRVYARPMAIPTVVITAPDVLRVIARSRRMRKRWPWRDHAAYTDRPLGELRREFGIRVLD